MEGCRLLAAIDHMLNRVQHNWIASTLDSGPVTAVSGILVVASAITRHPHSM